MGEGTTRRGTATPVHRPQRPAGSTHAMGPDLPCTTQDEAGLMGKSIRSFVGGATCRKTPISRSALNKNPMPGHLFVVPWSGIKFTSLAVEMRSLSHRTPGKLLAFTSAACCSSAWSMAPYSLASAVLYLTNLIHPESLCLPFFLQGSPLGSSKSGLGALLGADLANVTFLITESIKL